MKNDAQSDRRAAMVAVGERLRTLRLQQSPALSQEKAAKKIGMTRLAVISHEAGRVEIPEDTLERYATAYGTTVAYLRYGQRAENGAPASSPAPELPRATRVWLHKFLASLVGQGATDAEVEEAKRLLTSPPLISTLLGSGDTKGKLSDAEITESLRAIAEHAIVRVLRKRGSITP